VFYFSFFRALHQFFTSKFVVFVDRGERVFLAQGSGYPSYATGARPLPGVVRLAVTGGSMIRDRKSSLRYLVEVPCQINGYLNLNLRLVQNTSRFLVARDETNINHATAKVVMSKIRTLASTLEFAIILFLALRNFKKVTKIKHY